MKKMKSEIANEIEGVVNQLDIHKIRLVMEFLEWEWVTSLGLPTQADIYDIAYSLLEDAYNGFDNTPYPCIIEWGGLEASCSLVEGRYVFRVAFVISEGDNEHYE
jgi:hypothetical protein